MGIFDWGIAKKSGNSWDFRHKTQSGSTKHIDFAKNRCTYKKNGIVTKTYPIKKGGW